MNWLINIIIDLKGREQHLKSKWFMVNKMKSNKTCKIQTLSPPTFFSTVYILFFSLSISETFLLFISLRYLYDSLFKFFSKGFFPLYPLLKHTKLKFLWTKWPLARLKSKEQILTHFLNTKISIISNTEMNQFKLNSLPLQQVKNLPRDTVWKKLKLLEM